MSEMLQLLLLARGFEHASKFRFHARLRIQFLLRYRDRHALSAGTLKERIGWQRQMAAFRADEPVTANVT